MAISLSFLEMSHISLRRLVYSNDIHCKYILMFPHSWWRHQTETFSALLAFCEGNSPVTGEFPSQRPVTQSFNVFLHQRLNKRLSKPSRRWWFETPSRSLWRQRNDLNAARKGLMLWQTCDESSRTIPQRGVYVVKHGELLVAKIYGLLWMPIQNDFISGVAIWNSEMCVSFISINSLVPGDTIWRNRTMSTLVQVMACCLRPPSHYLNQCWLITSKVQRHSY